MRINPLHTPQASRPRPVQPAQQITDSKQEQKNGEIAQPHKTNAQPEKNIQISRELQQLRARDREVRSHEQAHLAAAGNHATSGASFSYNRGPDGRLYAVSGEVGIDTSSVTGDPRATLAKAETIKRAALAPANPSSQDIKIAAEASRMAIAARIDLQQQLKSAHQTENYQRVEDLNRAGPAQSLSTHA